MSALIENPDSFHSSPTEIWLQQTQVCLSPPQPSYIASVWEGLILVFSKSFWNTCYVASTLLGYGGEETKRRLNPCHRGAFSLGWKAWGSSGHEAHAHLESLPWAEPGDGGGEVHELCSAEGRPLSGQRRPSQESGAGLRPGGSIVGFTRKLETNSWPREHGATVLTTSSSPIRGWQLI